AKMRGRANTSAWCRALVTGRARGRAGGREARRREGAPGPGGLEWGAVPCRDVVQHGGESQCVVRCSDVDSVESSETRAAETAACARTRAPAARGRWR